MLRFIPMVTRCTRHGARGISGSAIVGVNKQIYRNKNDEKIDLSKTIKMQFIEAKSGDKIEVDAVIGKSVLDVALVHDIDIEGACGGELACSTCHVICSKELYDKLPAKKPEEDDMLDLAYGLTDTSRLCCQLKVTQELENAVFTVPAETNNLL